MNKWAIMDNIGICWDGDEDTIKVIWNRLKNGEMDEEAHEGDWKLIEIHEIWNG
jgi:hypothetical protein